MSSCQICHIFVDLLYNNKLLRLKWPFISENHCPLKKPPRTLIVNTRRANRHFVMGVQGGNFFCPPLNIFRGGGQEKCVLYSNTKKLTLPTGYSVSQDSWIAKLQNRVDFLPPPYRGEARLLKGGACPSLNQARGGLAPPLVARLMDIFHLL